MVGREAESTRLRAVLREAFAGRGQTVALLGEAGIGKTCLTADVGVQAEGWGGRVLVGRAWEAERAFPYGPWVDAFRQGGVIAEEQVGNIDPVWRAELSRLFPELGRGDSAPAAATEDPLRLLEAIVVLLRTLAASRPLLLVLEDLHWADEMSLRLLSFLVRRVSAVPILTLVTAREEEIDDAPILRDLLRRPEVARLPLTALSPEDTRALVATLVPDGEHRHARGSLAEQIWAASEGNPFLAIETLRALDEGVTPSASGELPVSERVREVIRVRLEKLGREARQLVATASVVGRQVEWALLSKASGLGETEAAEALEELVRRRLFRVENEQFDFVHARIREVVYGDLLIPRRRLLHRQVAEALEMLHDGDLDAHAVALGQHYHEAQEWTRALAFLRQAGKAAMAHSAYREAATFFEKALETRQRLPLDRQGLEESIDLRLQLRLCLTPSGDHEQRCLTLLEEARDLAQRLEDRRRLADILIGTSFHHWVSCDFETGRAVVEQGLVLAQADGSRAQVAEARIRLGRILIPLGRYRDALDELAKAGEMIVEPQSQGLGATILAPCQIAFYEASSLVELGEFAAARARLEPGIALAEARNHRHSLALTLTGRGLIELRRGTPDLAVPTLRRSLTLCEQIDYRVLVPVTKTLLAQALLETGGDDEALALLREAVATRHGPWQRTSVVALGAACLRAGGIDEARDLADQAIAAARKAAERGTEAWALWLASEIARSAVATDLDVSITAYRAALDLAGSLEMRPLVAHCHLGLATLHAEASDAVRARDHARQAAALYSEMDMPAWLARAQADQLNMGGARRTPHAPRAPAAE
jgi:tetratricopeptide (TPR) repeat protein